jgi:hypothetical protein
MRYIHRALERAVKLAARNFPCVVLTGPRRAGKTWLLRHLFPKASYFLLEDPTVVARLRADPDGFLDDLKTPAILDEMQNVPEMFTLVRACIDRQPRRIGQWFLTGSQEAPLMLGVTDARWLSRDGGAARRRATPASMQWLAEALKKNRPRGIHAERSFVYQSPKTAVATQSVALGVRAWAWRDLVHQL